MLKSQEKQEAVCGIILAVLCGLIGLVDAWMLAGLGICGFPLTRGMIIFALASALVLPSATARFYPLPGG